MRICVDASLVIKWLLPEEGSDTALKLFELWLKKDLTLIAPSLIDYEIGTTIRQKVLRGHLNSNDLFPIFDFYRRSGLQLFHLTDLVEKSVSAAAHLDQPTIYDVAYLLTAKQQEADYVTADEKFYKKVSPVYSFVKYYKDPALLRLG